MKSEVFNEDCMIGMSCFPDNHFDLAVVDPLYGISVTSWPLGSHPTRSRTDGFGSGPAISTIARMKQAKMQGAGQLKNRTLNNHSMHWDIAPGPEYFTELFRISKNQIIWGGNHFSLPPSRGIICWDKKQPWKNFSQWEMAWTSFHRPALMIRLSNTGGANIKKKIHPTEKPVALYTQLLSEFAAPGMRIIDTHMGSQNSRIAAHIFGCDYWGWEIDPGFYVDGCSSYSAYKAQQRLF